jgi:hypothetical protein
MRRFGGWTLRISCIPPETAQATAAPGDGWVSVPGHDDVTFELMPCRFVDVEPDGDTDGGDRREKQPTTKANQTFAFTRS